MSKGYPTRTDDAYPILDQLLPADACMVCKRRPAEAPSALCATCRSVLHPKEKAGS